MSHAKRLFFVTYDLVNNSFGEDAPSENTILGSLEGALEVIFGPCWGSYGPSGGLITTNST